MHFPDSYFEDEVRCGFYVDSMMKVCFATQLKVLMEIDRICQKYDIQYFAEWGTLLGAVRHEGFIPWDDDMDIGMKRIDYERFLKVAPKELPEGYEVLNYENEEHYWDVMARVVNTDFINVSPDFLDQNYNNPFASGIDIFPMDYVSNHKGEEEIQREMVELVKTVADTNGQGNLDKEELETWLTVIEEVSKQKIDREGNIKNQLYKILCSLYALYSEEESDRIALMAQYLDCGASVYPKECYADTIRMPFDMITIPVPIGYDTILKGKYGDYMKNVRKGGGHDYPYYERQIAFLKSRGTEFPHYEYPRNLNERVKNPTFRESLNKKLQLLGQIHEKLELLMQYGQQEMVLKLLQEAQNMAVNIGEAIEKKMGEATTASAEAVKCLEQYCELVFELYANLAQQALSDGSGVRSILDEALAFVREAVDAIHFKKEIVFMPYRANQWKAIESVWKAACADEDCDVKVVPISYFYKRRLGAAVSERHYDGKDFPDYVPIIPYEEYTLENNHPDQIYIQSPQDQWNHMLTVDSNYYSPILWKNTEELIYIPWFKTDEMNPEDERALISRKHFVLKPGVVNADKVIVQSEGMKQSYVDCLTEWAGEDTRSIWEEKILGLGSPLDDVEEELPERPAEWGSKKVLLYHVSGNGLLEKKENMLAKIEKTLHIFAEQADKLQIIWLQDVQMKQRLESRIPDVFHQYEKVLEQWQEQPWICIKQAEEETEAVQLADAYYGDTGKSAQLMKQLAKPVMLQNVEV